MKIAIILGVSLLCASAFAADGARAVNVVKCEEKIRALQLASFTAGRATEKYQREFGTRKDTVAAFEEMAQAQKAGDAALADAVSCLYE